MTVRVILAVSGKQDLPHPVDKLRGALDLRPEAEGTPADLAPAAAVPTAAAAALAAPRR